MRHPVFYQEKLFNEQVLFHRSTVAQWYAIGFIAGGPGFLTRGDQIYLKKSPVLKPAMEVERFRASVSNSSRSTLEDQSLNPPQGKNYIWSRLNGHFVCLL